MTTINVRRLVTESPLRLRATPFHSGGPKTTGALAVCPTLTLTGRGERMRAGGPVEREVRRAHLSRVLTRPMRRRDKPSPVHGALRWNLASRGTVEDDPHGEVVGEILEPVLDPCGHEDKVSGLGTDLGGHCETGRPGRAR